MNNSIDYTKLAASLDYEALGRKLTQLAERQPPKKRKHIADVLEPLRERLLMLQQKGWSSGQLSEELKAAGITVSAARLRECLSRWTVGGGNAGRRRIRRRQAASPTAATPAGPGPAPVNPKKPDHSASQVPFALR